MRISEVMTESVVTADCSASLREVGELMRDRNVGSVVICEHGYPTALITDRKLWPKATIEKLKPILERFL